MSKKVYVEGKLRIFSLDTKYLSMKGWILNKACVNFIFRMYPLDINL